MPTFVRLNNFVFNTDRIITLELVNLGSEYRSKSKQSIQYEIRAVMRGVKSNSGSREEFPRREVKYDGETTNYVKIRGYSDRNDADKGLNEYLDKLNQ